MPTSACLCAIHATDLQQLPLLAVPFYCMHTMTLWMQDHRHLTSCAWAAEQPNNPRPVQQSDDRILAHNLGPAV